MKDTGKTITELLEEISRLRLQIDDLAKTAVQPGLEGEVFKVIGDSIPVGIFIIQDHKTVFTNSYFSSRCGYSREELVSLSLWRDMVHPEDRGQVRASAIAMLKGMDRTPYEYRLLCKDGSVRWFVETVVPINWQGKRAVLGNTMAVTGRKRTGEDMPEIKTQLEALVQERTAALSKANEALRESEEVFRLLFEKSGDANLLMDGVRYIDCNEAALKIAGFGSKAKLINLTPADISPERQPDGALSSEKAKRMIDLAYAEGSNRFEWVRKRPDGTERYLDVMLTPIPLKGRRLLYTTWRDMTDRKMADDELQESRRRLANIIDFLPDATFVIDGEGRIIAWNRAIEEMTGIKAADMLGKGNYEYALPFYGTRRPILIDLVFKTREEIEKKYLFVRRNEDGILLAEADVSTDKKRCILWGIASPLYDSRGVLSGAIESIRDITERKIVEEALRESERQLASIIDFLPDATMVINREGRVIAWNRAIEVMTGVKAEKMLGRGNYEYAIPFYGERRPVLIDLALHPDDQLESQYTTIERKGEILFGESFTPGLHPSVGVHLSATASVLRDLKGEIIGAIECIRDNTERRRIEEDLQRSEKKYRDLVDNTLVGVYQAHIDGRILFANQAYARIFGYNSASEMIGANVINQYKDKGDRTRFLELIKQSGRVMNYELAVISRGGETKHILISSVMEGDVISGTIIDIAKRKQAEEALRESERRLSDIINFLPDATMVIDRAGRVIAWNRAIEALTGVLAADMIGKGDYEYAIPFYGRRRPILIDLVLEPQDDLERRYKGLKRQDNTIVGEAYIENLQGRTAYLLGTAAPLYDTKGTVIGAIESIRDITDRHRMEEALTREHDRLTAILDAIPISAFVIDRSRTVILWNQSSEIFAGKSKGEVLGRKLDLSYLCQGRRQPSLAELLLEMTDDEIMVKFGHRGVLKSANFPGRFESVGKVWPHGVERFVSIQAARIYDPDGNVAGAIQAAQDVTERIRLESQFHQAQKMEAIGTLAGGIAHDFNNILAAIIGYTELSVDEPDPMSRRRKLNEVLNASTRAKNLVKQILTFSRHTDHEKKPVDMRPITKEALKLIRSTLPTTIEIRQNITNAACTINADITQMHQIIMNLCANAAQAMGEKGGILTVSLLPADMRDPKLAPNPDLKPGFYIRLSVSDTGPGIEPEIRDRIFEPFFTTKATGEGTGLGLSVVYGIVKNHDGMIYVSSEQGKGATFDIYLPSIERGDAAIEVPEGEEIPGGHERILYVDDDEVLLDLTRLMLESLGYDVTAESNSVEVLGMFLASPEQYDLVITDMTMPIMPGNELAREVLQIRPDIPIILCTGFSEYIDEAKAKSLGIRAFIMKPFTKKALGRLVRDVLNGRAETDSAA
jgi:PAS domain S-box-containing protein